MWKRFCLFSVASKLTPCRNIQVRDASSMRQKSRLHTGSQAQDLFPWWFVRFGLDKVTTFKITDLIRTETQAHISNIKSISSQPLSERSSNKTSALYSVSGPVTPHLFCPAAVIKVFTPLGGWERVLDSAGCLDFHSHHFPDGWETSHTLRVCRPLAASTVHSQGPFFFCLRLSEGHPLLSSTQTAAPQRFPQMSLYFTKENCSTEVFLKD